MRIYVLYLYILVECKFVHSLLQQQTTSLVVTNMNMTISGAPLNARVGASANEPGKVSNWNEWLSDVTPAETYLFTVAAVQGGYIQIYIHVYVWQSIEHGLRAVKCWAAASFAGYSLHICIFSYIIKTMYLYIYVCMYIYMFTYQRLRYFLRFWGATYLLDSLRITSTNIYSQIFLYTYVLILKCICCHSIEHWTFEQLSFRYACSHIFFISLFFLLHICIFYFTHFSIGQQTLNFQRCHLGSCLLVVQFKYYCFHTGCIHTYISKYVEI